MKEHLHQPTAEGASAGDIILEPDNLELIAAEMDSLRVRMKLLESRLEKISAVKQTANPRPAPLASVGAQSPRSIQQNTAAESTAVSTATPSHRTARRPSIEKTSQANSKRSSTHRRKSRSNKTTKNLLFVYGLLIGGGLISVFVYMMMNLFNTDQYLPTGSSSAPLEITIDETPDLEELRRSIQDAEE